MAVINLSSLPASRHKPQAAHICNYAFLLNINKGQQIFKGLKLSRVELAVDSAPAFFSVVFFKFILYF